MQYLIDFGELALRVLLLGALGAVSGAITRRRGAAFQHAIWSAVLAGMLALPVLTAVLPPIKLRHANALPIVSSVVPRAVTNALPSAPQHVPNSSAPVTPPPRHRDFNWPAVVIAAYCVGATLLLLQTALRLRRTAGLV